MIKKERIRDVLNFYREEVSRAEVAIKNLVDSDHGSVIDDGLIDELNHKLAQIAWLENRLDNYESFESIERQCEHTRFAPQPDRVNRQSELRVEVVEALCANGIAPAVAAERTNTYLKLVAEAKLVNLI